MMNAKYPAITRISQMNPTFIFPRLICPQPGIRNVRNAAVPGSSVVDLVMTGEDLEMH